MVDNMIMVWMGLRHLRGGRCSNFYASLSSRHKNYKAYPPRRQTGQGKSGKLVVTNW